MDFDIFRPSFLLKALFKFKTYLRTRLYPILQNIENRKSIFSAQKNLDEKQTNLNYGSVWKKIFFFFWSMAKKWVANDCSVLLKIEEEWFSLFLSFRLFFQSQKLLLCCDRLYLVGWFSIFTFRYVCHYCSFQRGEPWSCSLESTMMMFHSFKPLEEASFANSFQTVKHVGIYQCRLYTF